MARTTNAINSVLIGQAQKDAFGEMAISQRHAIIILQFPYNINPQIVTKTETASGTVTQANSLAVVSSGAATSSGAVLRSNHLLHYKPGQGVSVFFTSVHGTGTAGNTQYAGIGDSVDGFFFGYNGTSFGILHRNNSSDTWIPQNSWNEDICDGNGNYSEVLDPTKGNVYKIQFQWLGFGNIFFYIEDPNSGGFVLVHQIKYPNANTAPSLTNPSLPLRIESTNTSNNTDVAIKVGSMGAFVEGPVAGTDLRFSINGSQASLTTEQVILSIQNKSTFAGKINKTTVYPDLVSFTNVGNPDCFYKLILNATIGGSPSYTDISTNESVVSYDTAGTTVANGTVLASFYVNGNNEATIDLSNLNIDIDPGDILTISGTSSGAAITANAAITWRERV